MGGKVIAITKEEEAKWNTVIPQLKAVFKKFFGKVTFCEKISSNDSAYFTAIAADDQKRWQEGFEDCSLTVEERKMIFGY